MKKLLLLPLLIILLTGCCTIKTDQELRNKIFMECLEKIPPGPQTTHYNDWDEVIEKCDTAARWQAQKKVCN